MFVWVHFLMQSLQKKFIFCIQMGRPWINPDQRVGQLLRESQKYSLREPQKESLRTTNPPTTTLVSVVAAPTHLPCISHHPTHPLPTKSLRCQVSTAPQAVAPPLNTRACMTWAHAKFQENSSCFFWYISWRCKVFKKVHFLHSNGPPRESTLIKGSDNCLGSLKNIRLGSLKKNRFAPPTHPPPPPPLYQLLRRPPTSLVSVTTPPTEEWH